MLEAASPQTNWSQWPGLLQGGKAQCDYIGCFGLELDLQMSGAKEVVGQARLWIADCHISFLRKG